MAYTDQRFAPDDAAEASRPALKTRVSGACDKQPVESFAVGQNAAALYDNDFFGAASQAVAHELQGSAAGQGVAAGDLALAKALAAAADALGTAAGALTTGKDLAGAAAVLSDAAAALSVQVNLLGAAQGQGIATADLAKAVQLAADAVAQAQAAAGLSVQVELQAAAEALSTAAAELTAQGSGQAVDLAGDAQGQTEAQADLEAAPTEPPRRDDGGGNGYLRLVQEHYEQVERKVTQDDAEVLELAAMFYQWRRAA